MHSIVALTPCHNTVTHFLCYSAVTPIVLLYVVTQTLCHSTVALTLSYSTVVKLCATTLHHTPWTFTLPIYVPTDYVGIDLLHGVSSIEKIWIQSPDTGIISEQTMSEKHFGQKRKIMEKEIKGSRLVPESGFLDRRKMVTYNIIINFESFKHGNCNKC